MMKLVRNVGAARAYPPTVMGGQHSRQRRLLGHCRDLRRHVGDDWTLHRVEATCRAGTQLEASQIDLIGRGHRTPGRATRSVINKEA